ncbi:hypothetical protein IEQ34_003696 [Dendrobium chrysotoxum]|uniref:MADS-box domain-containing protein n=1 Tax=Dendrobium chrysotoxum TaxID=161865 RepID=A0AAV7HG67_DENCH|nr:hypothetical protein IEQ34_003696 [Dendrobium chrysotoxum]
MTRQVTFSKKGIGRLKKARELAILCDAELTSSCFDIAEGGLPEAIRLEKKVLADDWEHDDSVEDYVDRILFQLTETIDEQKSMEPWFIASRPPSSTSPATSPADKALRVTCLVVASLGLLLPLLR